MPLRVVIDDEVGHVLKQQAEPLVDSVNSVLRRILGLPGIPQAALFFEVEQLETGQARQPVPEGVAQSVPAPTSPRRQRAPKTKRRRAKSDEPRSRAPKGSLLDEKAYWKPILQTLAERPDGALTAREVVEQVGVLISGRLTELDREHVSSGGVRWHTRVMFARLRMKDAGLLEADSPRGVWEISELGRQALKDGRLDAADK